jgi:phosphoglycolate phosphatase
VPEPTPGGLGDTPLDVTGAHAAGIECVGVGSHKYSADQLREAGADYAITSLEEGLLPLADPD